MDIADKTIIIRYPLSVKGITVKRSAPVLWNHLYGQENSSPSDEQGLATLVAPGIIHGHG